MITALWPRLAPILLLLGSNVFMTFAWYGHLRQRSWSMLLAIGVSWMIALPEYCLAVPANRIGEGPWTTAELKTIQEVITLIVFTVFSALYLHEPVRLSTLLGFCLIFAGAALVFLKF